MTGMYRCVIITRSSAEYDVWPVVVPAPKATPLPFFLDPQQIADLTPEVDWSRRVSDRIEAFREFAMRPALLAA
jgi:hypothetical protein